DDLRRELLRHRGSRSPLDRHILYLNFDGAAIQSGRCSDAPTNCSLVNRTGGTFNFPPADLTSSAKQSIIDQVTAYYRDFNVEVVTTRPASGSYSMTMIGPGSAIHGVPGSAGVAPLDCGDLNPNDISFVFTNGEPGTNLEYAVAIGQESAHAY